MTTTQNTLLHGLAASIEDEQEEFTAAGMTRSFGPVRALWGMDLTASAGVITALVGSNGSGKTTLLVVLASLLRPDAGSVTIADADRSGHPTGTRNRTGWMLDTLDVWEALTVREILETMGRFYGVELGRVRWRASCWSGRN